MSETGFVSEMPANVVAITKPKGQGHKRNWILIAARDKDFDFVAVTVDEGAATEVLEFGSFLPYSKFFDVIGKVAHKRQTTWIVGFNVRHVLEETHWIERLEAGEIELERQRKLVGKQSGSGRVCLSQGFTDVDLRVNGRKVKILDWDNYGISVQDHGLQLNDVYAVKCLDIFMKWIEAYTKIGLAVNKSSAAQIGWNKLRQSLTTGYIFTSLDPNIRALERRCYYGGRCEPFRLGRVLGKCYIVDIKGCYASICRDHRLPSMPTRYYPNGVCVHALRNTDSEVWAADVVLKCDKPIYPRRHYGKTIYPVGEFSTSLCGLEFSDAVSAGHVVKVLRAVKYDHYNILENYANWYMQSRDRLRTHGYKVFEPGIKATFNSSLGFLARQGREWCDWNPAGGTPWWFGMTFDPDDHTKMLSAHVLQSKAEFLRVGSEQRNCSPIVHAAICAIGRQMLARLFEVAGHANYYYCDTDGMIVNQKGYDNLLANPYVFGPGYGQLSVRHQADECHINGQKNYRVGTKVVCAGMSAFEHGQWSPNVGFECETGTVNSHGFVDPFKLTCDDRGDMEARYVTNET